jgi:flagellar L-ring protein precursor FlgH
MNRLQLDWKSAVIAWALVALVSVSNAKDKKNDPARIRAEYLAQVQQQQPASGDSTGTANPGSLWNDDGKFSNLTSDYKASHLNDTVLLVIVQDTLAQSSANANTQRTLTANSGINGLAGGTGTSLIDPLLAIHSDSTLKGQGQAATTSKMRTSLAGQVIAVLPNGNLVVEGQRQVLINREKETVVIRGVARPGDVGFDNSLLSTSLANLQIELKGKGVISDSTRPANAIVRQILKVVGF